MNKITFMNVDLYYKTYGRKGNQTVILIHGYLESMEIFCNLAEDLQNDYFVIVPDLPGHGASKVYSEKHSLEKMAESVKLIMDFHGIERVHLLGHSMGGYVTLAFRELFPERLLSFSLLHSHCFADSDEKKTNREKEIDLIKSGKKELIVKTNIPRTYATDNLGRFSNEVERSLSIALKTPEKGIVALLNGMKVRPDRSIVLKEGGIPSYLFAGMKDNLISVEMNDEMMSFAKDMKRFDLFNSGHMGFVEEKDRVVEIIQEIVSGKKV